MALILYTGINKQGDHFRRLEEVEDVDEIYDLADLNGEELFQIIRLPKIPGYSPNSHFSSLKDKEVVEFCYQLSMYLEGGVDIRQIFEDIINESVSPSLKKVVKKISARIAEGESLSSAFRHTRVIPDIVVTLVEIGEKSGQLANSLKDAASYIERQMELRAATMRALIYPSFTVAIMIVALVFWITFVIPQIVNVIRFMDVELPVQTQMLLTVSEFIKSHWYIEVLGLLGLVGLVVVGMRFNSIRYYMEKLWWHMPITGRVVSNSQMAFYFNYFKVLYDAGIPVIEILIRMQKSVPSLYFRKAVQKSNKQVMEGESLQVGYSHAKLFEPMAIRIIGVGEHTGNLQKQLDLLGRIYLKRVQVFVETLPKILEPVFIIAVGLFFALFASTLLGPLYQVIVRVTGAS